jgi:hypothetical protein
MILGNKVRNWKKFKNKDKKVFKKLKIQTQKLNKKKS